MNIRRYLGISFWLLIFAAQGMAQASNPCSAAQAFHIVVLGSSTAAGSGPSSPDSTWVNRYRRHLQGINAGNQVTNLAVGGFTTYRLMPTGYIPPASRPAPDTTHNITTAINLNPDVIIINMPSNDVSNGFTVAEQLHNFDTIIGLATLAGIPVWISTTQPKNYGSQTNINMQIEVRDSIFAIYGSHAIDFWTTIATPSGTIDPLYDSGDGTHLNNAGHRILFHRVADKDIPGELYSAASFPDIAVTALEPLYLPICGDSASQFQIAYANFGQFQGTPDFVAALKHLGTGQTVLSNIAGTNLISTCTADSFAMTFNTSLAGDYELAVWTVLAADSNAANDTLRYFFHTLGHPTIIGLSDTACAQTSLQLQAIAEPQDTVFWYDAPIGGAVVGNGAFFQTPILNNSAIYYAEAVRGPLYFVSDITTTLNSGINWNGAMFDVIAQTALTIDSLGVKINTLGTQSLGFYTKSGTHFGAQTSSGLWTLLGTSTVQVNSASALTNVPIPAISMQSGDTLGIYVYMVNGSSNLSYQSVTQPVSRSDGQMEIVTGSGVSAGFSATYSPRDWNGRVFYHYGNRPEGDCSTGRIPVEAIVSVPQVSLPADTIIDVNDSLSLNAGSGFAQYSWSTGGNGQVEQLTGASLGTGIHIITVTVTDQNGCTASDEIIVGVAYLLGTESANQGHLTISPNPARDKVQLRFEGETQGGEVLLRNSLGQVVYSQKLEAFIGPKEISLSQLPMGAYIVEWHSEDKVYRRKLWIVR